LVRLSFPFFFFSLTIHPPLTALPRSTFLTGTMPVCQNHINTNIDTSVFNRRLVPSSHPPPMTARTHRTVCFKWHVTHGDHKGRASPSSLSSLFPPFLVASEKVYSQPHVFKPAFDHCNRQFKVNRLSTARPKNRSVTSDDTDESGPQPPLDKHPS